MRWYVSPWVILTEYKYKICLNVYGILFSWKPSASVQFCTGYIILQPDFKDLLPLKKILDFIQVLVFRDISLDSGHGQYTETSTSDGSFRAHGSWYHYV